MDYGSICLLAEDGEDTHQQEKLKMLHHFFLFGKIKLFGSSHNFSIHNQYIGFSQKSKAFLKIPDLK